jgi:uncharacterized protein (DUF58 family)
VPGLVRRLRSGAAAGARASGVAGGAFLFRGHRAYRAGDDLRRVDWGVYGRTGRVMVREYEAERDVRTEVWVDGSASSGPFRGWPALARATAVACAIGVSGGGPYRLGVLRGTEAETLLEGDDPAGLRDALIALSGESPAGRFEAGPGLARLRARMPPRARFFLASDLLVPDEPSALDRFAGRGAFGALLHLRVPEVTAPEPGALWDARDAETGEARTVRFTPELCARVVARAAAHADRWARRARRVGLAYVPFAPATPAEDLVRRLAFEVP